MLAMFSIKIKESYQTREKKKEKIQKTFLEKIYKISLRLKILHLNILYLVNLTFSKNFILINDDFIKIYFRCK